MAVNNEIGVIQPLKEIGESLPPFYSSSNTFSLLEDIWSQNWLEHD